LLVFKCFLVFPQLDTAPRHEKLQQQPRHTTPPLRKHQKTKTPEETDIAKRKWLPEISQSENRSSAVSIVRKAGAVRH
jgi:hypothetical protein